MKFLMTLVLLGGAVFGSVEGYKYWDKQTDLERAGKRVEGMIAEWQTRNGSAEQAAISWWRYGYNNKPVGSDSYTSWTNFWSAQGIRKVTSFELDSLELVEEDDVLNRYVIAECTINGKELAMRVQENERITWIEYE